MHTDDDDGGAANCANEEWAWNFKILIEKYKQVAELYGSGIERHMRERERERVKC